MLFGGEGRDELMCISSFTTVGSARTFASVARSHSQHLETSYGARIERVHLLERIAEYDGAD